MSKKEIWGTVIKVLIAVLTGVASAFGLSSCMAAAGVHGLGW